MKDIRLKHPVKVNLEKMISRKAAVVEQTTKGINFLMDKNKVSVFHGTGSIFHESGFNSYQRRSF